MNLWGLDIVGSLSGVLMVIILSPFVIEFFYVAIEGKIRPKVWGTYQKEPNWSLYFSSLLWNMTGWDQLGAVAGEVKDVGKTYPRAVLLTICLSLFVFIIPVISGLAVFPDSELWEAGLFSTIACSVSPWLGIWMLVASMMSNLGQGNAQLSSNSRALGAMGNSRHVFPFFSKTWSLKKSILKLWARLRKTRSVNNSSESFPLLPPPDLPEHESAEGPPIFSILFLGVTTCILMLFDFNFLVEVDLFLNGFTLFLELGALVWLRYKEPNTHRPFLTPGGLVVLWIMALLKGIIIGGMLLTSGPQVGGVAVAILVGAGILSAFRSWLLSRLKSKEN